MIQPIVVTDEMIRAALDILWTESGLIADLRSEDLAEAYIAMRRLEPESPVLPAYE